MRAIVVDDSRVMRIILRRILEPAGFQVLEAGDGQEALSLLQQHGPAELAFIDWNMPVMNGFDLVREIRRQSAYDSMRLMMVTTETEIEHVAKAIEAGANEYLMKPFTAELVREKLHIIGFEGN